MLRIHHTPNLVSSTRDFPLLDIALDIPDQHGEDEDEVDIWVYWGTPGSFVADFLNYDINEIAGLGNANYSSSHTLTLQEKTIRVDAVKMSFSSIDHSRIAEIVEAVFINRDFPNLTPLQKYYAYCKAYVDIISTDITSYKLSIVANRRIVEHAKEKDILPPFNFEFITNEEKAKENYHKICSGLENKQAQVKSMRSFIFNSLADVLKHFLNEIIENNATIKKCQNCGKYFAPENRSDTIFCNNVSPQDPSKTCQTYGKYANYLKKTRTNEATKLYKQIYNALANKVKRCEGNPKLKNNLESFKVQAKQWKADVKADIKTEAEYIDWLKEIKAKKVL